jgi:hypothetical protein
MMKKLIIILLLFASVLAGCRYKEGPLISFHSALNRLYGTHTLKQYTVNGQDSLNLYYDTLGLSFRLYYEEVYGHNDCVIGEGQNIHGHNSGWVVWTWILDNNNKNLKVLTSVGSNNATGPIGAGITPEWQILKLKKGDIKIKTMFNGKEYIVELK